MSFPNRETVDAVKAAYPIGCRVVLDQMDDATAPPTGTQGTVCAVDDTGTIHCAWDNGSGLGVVYGEDRCHKIATEEEAWVTLNWYGTRQPDEDARCPRCGSMMSGSKHRYALSRYANISVCDFCGVTEALEQAGFIPAKPLLEWYACMIPQTGGGAWRK